jgi:myb proto-oncogene protein
MSEWLIDDDIKLIAVVRSLKVIDWDSVARSIPFKTIAQCVERWLIFSKNYKKHKRRQWTEPEDRLLAAMVARLGTGRWREVSQYLFCRTGKQCGERYKNHLDPQIDRSPWKPHEILIIETFRMENGNRWSKLSKLLPGRPTNAIKNYCNNMKRKGVTSLLTGTVSTAAEISASQEPVSKRAKTTQSAFQPIPTPALPEPTPSIGMLPFGFAYPYHIHMHCHFEN